MDGTKNYKASTNEKFRQILKLFFKVIYGNCESYPEQVKFFSVKVGREKYGRSQDWIPENIWKKMK